MKIIEVIVSPSGETRIETKGFSGTGCKDATKQLQAALGATVSDKATAEMYSVQAGTGIQAKS